MQPVKVRWRPLETARLAFWDAVESLSDYIEVMVAVLLRLPVLLLWFFTVAGFTAASWRMLRWVWRRWFATAAA